MPALLIALRVRVLTALLAGLLAMSALLVALRIIAGLLVCGLLLITAAVLILVLGTHKELLERFFRFHPSNGNVPAGAGFPLTRQEFRPGGGRPRR